MSDAASRILRSDKHFWHRYTEIYEPILARMADVRLIVEIGVFRGDSIAWLAERFDGAAVVGVDILPVQPGWPVAPGISYRQADQGDRVAMAGVFDTLPGAPDLVIEDGSHIPQHQATSLAEGFARLREGGLYILEDICTSHPLTTAFAHHALENGRQLPTTLHVLLALQHLRDTGGSLEPEVVEALAHPAFLSPTDIALLWQQAARIEIHKRTKLPLSCYACGTSDFDYVAWTCACGAALYEPSNSMTALIWKR